MYDYLEGGGNAYFLRECGRVANAATVGRPSLVQRCNARASDSHAAVGRPTGHLGSSLFQVDKFIIRRRVGDQRLLRYLLF